MDMHSHDTYMERTTIILSEQLRQQAQVLARSRGITLSELIRRQLALALRKKKPVRSEDPLFRPRRLMSPGGPSDVAARHDDYLYGKKGRSSKS